MNYVSITGITVAIAVVIVLAVALVSYMSSLVKNAYQIKIDIRADMEASLRKMEEELGKKSRWMRKELGEDLEKMKYSLEQDNQARLAAIEQKIRDSIVDLDAASVEDRRALRENIKALRKRLAGVEQDIGALKDEAARRAAMGRPRWDRDTAKPSTPTPDPAAASSTAETATDEGQDTPVAPLPAPAETAPPADGTPGAGMGEASQGATGGAAAPAVQRLPLTPLT